LAAEDGKLNELEGIEPSISDDRSESSYQDQVMVGEGDDVSTSVRDLKEIDVNRLA